MGAAPTDRPGEGGTEPFPGYADADIPTVSTAIELASEGAERETLKAAIRTAEQARRSPRQGVLDLTEPAAPPPPAPPESAAGGGDASGRPDLSDVAQQRYEDRRRGARVIDTSKEA